MVDWIRVMPLDEMPEGRGLRVETGGHRIAIFRIGDDVYAVGDECSHAEASLAEGELFDHEVECPRHGSEFDVRTGEPHSLPATRPVATYATRVADGDVFLQVGEET